MTPKRALALAAAAVAAIIVAMFFVGGFGQRQDAVLAPDQQQKLLVLTALPIVFPERLTLDAPASPVLEALQQRYRIEPISVTAADALKGARLLLMAQPQAQPAEQLVELDRWVREGGRVLLLADPMLAWRGDWGLSDHLAPPFTFPDTGLLGHWGLRLDSPDSPGPVELTIEGQRIRSVSVGTLAAIGPGCSTDRLRLIARCKVGKGQATVIADADFLDVGDIEGVDEDANLNLLLAELKRLEQ